MTFWKLADSQGMETGSLGDVRCLDSFSPVLPSFTEKAMAPHPSALAWRIPGTGEPGGLQSTGSLRVGHDWATSRSLFTFMPWRRQWHPTPVFLPEESQGRGSLVGCHLWGRTESDTTERLSSSSSHWKWKWSRSYVSDSLQPHGL